MSFHLRTTSDPVDIRKSTRNLWHEIHDVGLDESFFKTRQYDPVVKELNKRLSNQRVEFIHTAFMSEDLYSCGVFERIYIDRGSPFNPFTKRDNIWILRYRTTGCRTQSDARLLQWLSEKKKAFRKEYSKWRRGFRFGKRLLVGATRYTWKTSSFYAKYLQCRQQLKMSHRRKKAKQSGSHFIALSRINWDLTRRLWKIKHGINVDVTDITIPILVNLSKQIKSA